MGLVPATSESGRLSRLRERLKDGQRDRPAHRSLLIGFTVAWCILAGTILGSLLVGLLDTFGKAYFPSLSYFTLFAPLALILLWRPQGLLGRKELS